MAGEVCPKCGVAVTPGYVRCPNRNCRARLPPSRRATTSAGGTAVESRGFPIVPVAIAGGALVVLLVGYFALRGGGSTVAASPPPPAPSASPAPAAAAPTSSPSPTPIPAPPPAANRPSPESVAAELDRELKRKHLWSTVSAIGDHLEIRSGSCRDPGMTAELGNAAAAAKAAGLVRLRCLEESGTVVFERDL